MLKIFFTTKNFRKKVEKTLLMDRKGGPLDAVNKVYFINGREGGTLANR